MLIPDYLLANLAVTGIKGFLGARKRRLGVEKKGKKGGEGSFRSEDVWFGIGKLVI
jgi:hypothetical protein